MTAALPAILCSALFGAAGWLGTVVADARYGAIGSEADGPLSSRIPRTAFLAASGSVGLLVGWHGTAPGHVALLLLAVFSLTVCAATDGRAGFIPDLFTLGPLALVVATGAFEREWNPLWGALFAFVPFAAMALVSRGRGMGWGDVKLAALGGSLAGMGGIAFAVVAASGAAYAVGLATGRARRPIAFGPYLAAAIAVSIALGSST